MVGPAGFEPAIRQKMSSHVQVHLIFSGLQMHGPVWTSVDGLSIGLR